MSRLLTALRHMGGSLLEGLRAYRHYEYLRARRIPHGVALKAAMADRSQHRIVTTGAAVTTGQIMHAKPAHA